MPNKLDIKNATFICPRNDAESSTIIDILNKFKLEVRISKQTTWFCPLEKEPNVTFDNLKATVVIIEMPGLELERKLAQNHSVIIIDHHGYASLGINRENPQSSIEQVAELIGYNLNYFEKGISINDQEYIYGLIKKGYSEADIQKIRTLDLQMQGYTDEQFLINLEDNKSPIFYKPDTYHYKSSIPKFSFLIDLHVMKQKGKFTNIVITGFADERKKQFIFYSGSAHRIEQLKILGGYSKLSNSQYGLWGGYEEGAEKVNIPLAMKIILG